VQKATGEEFGTDEDNQNITYPGNPAIRGELRRIATED
jgi:hypothetical protein